MAKEKVLFITERTDVDGNQAVADFSGRNFSIDDASGFQSVLVTGEDENGQITVIEYPNVGEIRVREITKGKSEVFRYLTGGKHTPTMTTVAINIDPDKI